MTEQGEASCIQCFSAETLPFPQPRALAPRTPRRELTGPDRRIGPSAPALRAASCPCGEANSKGLITPAQIAPQAGMGPQYVNWEAWANARKRVLSLVVIAVFVYFQGLTSASFILSYTCVLKIPQRMRVLGPLKNDLV